MRKAIVTWYNGRLNKFPEHIGVAHRTLPIGTLVEFRRNGVTQLAVVNDRGPWGFTYKKGKKHYSYDFDISLKLAHILGIKRMGVAAVEYAIKGRIK
jgi:rare lipoprotein A (peptidoglycan hydrolase)